jgi:hypothetical protein
MTNKLIVIIYSLKVRKIKKLLLYEMKFFVPNYSCLQNPWLVGYHPQIPVSSAVCAQLSLLNPPSEQNSLVRHWFRALEMPLLVFLHGSFSHLTVEEGQYCLWDSRWRLACKMTWTLWKLSCYKQLSQGITFKNRTEYRLNVFRIIIRTPHWNTLTMKPYCVPTVSY